ncbi:MAG TPA: DapH/DapD/GlmU-related protein [Gemmatimonadaceae bacterium]
MIASDGTDAGWVANAISETTKRFVVQSMEPSDEIQEHVTIAARPHLRARPIVVGDRAWIGAGSIVVPGATIGANALIGAGSLVTSDLPADCLAYGQPCRVQRRLDTPASGHR